MSPPIQIAYARSFNDCPTHQHDLEHDGNRSTLRRSLERDYRKDGCNKFTVLDEGGHYTIWRMCGELESNQGPA